MLIRVYKPPDHFVKPLFLDHFIKILEKHAAIVRCRMFFNFLVKLQKVAQFVDSYVQLNVLFRSPLRQTKLFLEPSPSFYTSYFS